MNDTTIIIDKTEYSIVECKGCHQLKKKYYAGRYPNNKDKRWVDLDGKQWNGKYCSICHAYKQAQKKRIDKKNVKVLAHDQNV